MPMLGRYLLLTLEKFMRPFNLDEALDGKPVQLRNGDKAWGVADTERLGCKCHSHTIIVVDNYGVAYDYHHDGRFLSNDKHEIDIVGMYPLEDI